MSFVKVLRGGQITMPKECRKAFAIKEGDILEVEIEENKILLVPQVLIENTHPIDLSLKGEQMLNQALEEVKEGKTKEFDNVKELINDLHKYRTPDPWEFAMIPNHKKDANQYQEKLFQNH